MRPPSAGLRSHRALPRQLRLKLRRARSFRREDFVASPSNADALAALDAWPTWRGGVLALVGGGGAGKSHLARAFAAHVNAAVLTPEDATPLSALRGRPVVIDDADRFGDEERLYHLINMAADEAGGLLLTAAAPPVAWGVVLPDLRSRLAGVAVAALGEPDDAVLEGLLRKFFRERSIEPSGELLAYLLKRMERSTAGAREIVRQLDRASGAEHRPVTRALARQVLEEPETLGLFRGNEA